jgi:multidrug efflux system membrane fusion protein
MEAMLDTAARHPVASPAARLFAPVPARLALSGALALAVAVVLAGCGGGAGRGPQRVPIAVAAVVSRSVPYEIEATGTVEPLQSAEVTAQAGGLITSVRIREGAEVAEGQPLFQIDPRPYEAARAEAAAALARARAQAETARLDAEHAEALAAQQLVSPDELRTKRSTSAAMAATVSADSAALMSADLDLEHATVRAPIGGRTGSLAVHEGDLVRANTSPLVSINRLRPIRVRFTVSQSDLPEVRRARGGGPARVDIAPSETDSTWISGTLAFVDNAVDAASGTLLLKAETANRDGALWPGQFVRVRLRLYDQAGAVVVPAAAVTSSQKGPYCYVVAPDTTVEMRPVTVQRTWRDLAVIASGLKSGETVVTDGQLRLSPGARAVIRNPAGTPSAASDGRRGGGDGGGSADGSQRAAKRDAKGGGK